MDFFTYKTNQKLSLLHSKKDKYGSISLVYLCFDDLSFSISCWNGKEYDTFYTFL